MAWHHRGKRPWLKAAAGREMVGASGSRGLPERRLGGRCFGLVGAPASGGAAGADEKVRLAACVALSHVRGVKPGPAAGRGGGRRGPRRAAGRELVVWDVEGERAGRDV